MKSKQKILALALAAILPLSAVACAKEDKYDSYNYDLSEYIRVGTYKGVEIEDVSYEVTDEDIDNYVLLARSNYAEATEKTDPAEWTDTLNIDFVGYQNGETFDGGSAEGYDLTLGSGQLIDGFEEGLVGAKPGESVTLELHFPDPYSVNPTLSGQPVTFVVTVNHIYAQTLPEYTDAFVLANYGYESIAAFESALRTSMEEQYESERQYYRISQAWNTVLTEAEVLKTPQTEYDAMTAEYIAYYTSLAEAESITLNEYTSEKMGMTVKEFEDWVAEEVNAYLKEEMILYYIARAEDISVSDAEYESGALEYAAYYGLSSVEELEAYFDPADIRKNLLFDKVLEFLADEATVTSVSAKN